ncbi:hypothetical protein K7957_12260 [Sphingomonas yunnanensis]|uniref:hypothetical protein n=1 Tax=Sphingomonas yunnanensis TaxID=310400 RepID=UPI001CA78061|nr:hypothetical protein [Sphingomonas yunnanensis]MBY9063706.1 hypothetical protein [Sphingomonas yunnanensis]
MDTATSPAVDRIARVLAGQHLSANGHGDSESASAQVDATWKDYRDDAIAVLHTLRAPSPAMAAAGDVAVWERMVLAAIAEAKPGIVM